MRPRKEKAANKLPPRVYQHGKQYRLHPKSGGSIALCPITSPLSVVWLEYEKYVTANKSNTQTLINEYFESKAFHSLAHKTQMNNLRMAKNIIAVFGEMAPNSITPKHARAFLDARGLKSESAANNEFSLLAKILAWAYERGKINQNPCKGVKKFPAKKRDRYITDDEYYAAYHCADDAVKVAMEISYLCAARISDVLALKRSDLLEEGIYIKQGKTGKQQIKQWSPRLRAAIAKSKELSKTRSIFVVCNTQGQAIKAPAFDARWQKVKRSAHKIFGIDVSFTFHDIKAKSISDYEGTVADKQRFSGHKAMQQVDTYDRKPDIVPSLGSSKSK